MPTMSMRLPLTKMAIVNAQNAGLNTSPICSLVIWKARLSGPAMSPRMANTTDAVAIDRQLATNNRCRFIKHLSTTSARNGPPTRTRSGVRSRTAPGLYVWFHITDLDAVSWYLRDWRTATIATSDRAS